MVKRLWLVVVLALMAGCSGSHKGIWRYGPEPVMDSGVNPITCEQDSDLLEVSELGWSVIDKESENDWISYAATFTVPEDIVITYANIRPVWMNAAGEDISSSAAKEDGWDTTLLSAFSDETQKVAISGSAVGEGTIADADFEFIAVCWIEKSRIPETPQAIGNVEITPGPSGYVHGEDVEVSIRFESVIDLTDAGFTLVFRDDAGKIIGSTGWFKTGLYIEDIVAGESSRTIPIVWNIKYPSVFASAEAYFWPFSDSKLKELIGYPNPPEKW